MLLLYYPLLTASNADHFFSKSTEDDRHGEGETFINIQKKKQTSIWYGIQVIHAENSWCDAINL